MKVINSINMCYEEQLAKNKILKERVDEIIKNKKKNAWHYISRIKPKESFALKIETGRVSEPDKLEDFFACTLVVDNSIEIKNALNLIEQNFNRVRRKPPRENFTHNTPESFSYENLRLYVKLNPQKSLPSDALPNLLSDILFEVQIKTFLQHAWEIATHDLIYKSGEISWAKQRLAYQIKAVLEHAEISIHEIEKIKDSVMLAKTDETVKKLNKIKKFLTTNWKPEHLPIDLIRLSRNVGILLEKLGITISDLQQYLNDESNNGKGVNTINLPPYFIILQTIINQRPQKLNDAYSDSDNRHKLVVPIEVDARNLDIDSDKLIQIGNVALGTSV